MGFEGRLVNRGMRAIASTIRNEHGWDSEQIEVALAHVDKDGPKRLQPSGLHRAPTYDDDLVE
jgi:hypothetical protein